MEINITLPVGHANNNFVKRGLLAMYETLEDAAKLSFSYLPSTPSANLHSADAPESTADVKSARIANVSSAFT